MTATWSFIAACSSRSASWRKAVGQSPEWLRAQLLVWCGLFHIVGDLDGKHVIAVNSMSRHSMRDEELHHFWDDAKDHVVSAVLPLVKNETVRDRLLHGSHVVVDLCKNRRKSEARRRPCRVGTETSPQPHWDGSVWSAAGGRSEGTTMTEDNTMAQQANGHDASDLIDEIGELVESIPDREQARPLIERVRDTGSPFEQKSHTLMLEAVDKVTQQWIGELVNIREANQAVEQMVVQQAALLKEQITKLHLLGMQAMKEAQRAHDFHNQLGTQLDAMMGENGQRH